MLLIRGLREIRGFISLAAAARFGVFAMQPLSIIHYRKDLAEEYLVGE